MLPTGVVRAFGGLHVDLASTAMVGLGEGARYLVEYPYGCAEQRASRALALLLSADLGEAFKLPGIEPAGYRSTVQSALKELERFQCDDGGFAYWPGDVRDRSPYLTAYLLHVFKVGRPAVSTSTIEVVEKGCSISRNRARKKSRRPTRSWWPAYTAWQAFAVKVLVEGGRNQDSNITRLYGYRERMPVFALAYLADALVAKGEGGACVSRNCGAGWATPPAEGDQAHVEELNDPA